MDCTDASATCHWCDEMGKLSRCARCKRLSYCGRKCQGAHWKAGHATECGLSLPACPRFFAFCRSCAYVVCERRIPGPASCPQCGRALVEKHAASSESLKALLDTKPEGDFCAAAELELGERCDGEEALAWFEKAAARGEPNAMYRLGAAAKGSPESLAWFREAARGSHSGACYELGQAFIVKDQAQAAYWLRRAAARGHLGAAVAAGALYERGLGAVPRDEARALALYRSAAERGYAPAMRRLGGAARDDADGFPWYVRASDAGDHEAMVYVAHARIQGQDGAPEKDVDAGVALMKRAAASGSCEAMHQMGLFCGLGLGPIEQDEKAAARWWMQAATKNYANSQFLLGRAYCAGDGVDKDAQEGIHWLRRAAASGQQQAAALLKTVEGNAAAACQARPADSEEAEAP